MTYTSTSPASTAGPGNAPPICQNCQTSTTPLWRRDESGSVLCNACGLFLKLHGRSRPISLKTDVIKSRNRVKSSSQSQKRKSQVDTMTISAIRSDAGTPPANHAPSHNGRASDRSNSPVSRIDTPSLHHDPNIAPQHLFDGAVNLNSDTYHPSPSLPALHLSHPSPGSTPSLNGRHLEPPLTYEDLHRENDKLKTRVSELEVINMLTKQDLDTARANEDELKRRVGELERRIQERETEPPPKKLRLSDVVQGI